MRVILLIGAVLLAVCSVSALNNGLALTPQMGWNSWNHFACDINETVIRDTGAALVSTGLASVGYTYLNIDDCWAGSRDNNGNIVPDPKSFPSGMKALADYVHGLGLKFGVYSDAGLQTCAGRPGSLGYEVNDANSYASWGVDYLKYDNCNDNNTTPESRYPKMRDALNATGRSILFSMCEWGVDNPATWAPSVGNSWRTTGDISDNWASMTSRIDLNDQVGAYAGPGGWNDPDMLEVGNGGMTTAEYRSHFSLWCLSKAPLLIGNDIRNMSPDTLTILTNKELIAVNQDPLGVQGRKLMSTGPNGVEVWAGPQANGDTVAVLFNRSPESAVITAEFLKIGVGSQNAAVRDLWQHQDLGTHNGAFVAVVPSHDVVVVRLTPQPTFSQMLA